MRTFKNIAALLILLCAMRAAAEDRKPNILLIVGDDMGYADVGFHGCKDIPTPNLDALAASGVNFTSGYVSGPYCSPTRAAMLTGRYQQRFGHEFNPSGPKAGMPVTETTLADHLKAAGYATGLIGKWHLGSNEGMHPQKRGFDEFFGFLGGAHSYFNVGGILRGNEPVKELDYTTDAFGREAVSFIDRHKGSPWFLYLAFNAVHTPMDATDDRLAKFPTIADKQRRTYDAMMLAMDDAIGRVRQKLTDSGLERDTLVFFISDNGGPTMKGVTVNGSLNDPLRGSKRTTLEGGVRVPFVVSWPGHVKPGVFEQPAIQLDLHATALAAAGVAVEPEWKLDGVNLLPFLAGTVSGAPHSSLCWRFGEQMAIRSGDFKLVRYDVNADSNSGGRAQGVSPAKLYDLRADIGETKDLAQTMPDKVKELQTQWDQWNQANVKPLWGAGAGDNDGPEPGANPKKEKRQIQPVKPLATLILFFAASILGAAETGPRKPNLILIYTDDHGYADLGCVGVMADVRTPHIDALAKGGALMAAGYVTAPQCSPSRCGVISGQYQGKFGMDHNGMLESDPKLLERFNALNLLPKRMKAAGYTTGMAGKSHLGSNESADLVKLGFDKVFFKHSDAPGSWNMDLSGQDMPPQAQKGGYYHLEMIADFGCAFLNRFKDQPMFLYLAFRGPHVPLDAPKKYLDRFPGEMPVERRKALGAISCIDDGVGKIMETLRKNGLEENTLVFLISDNGAPIKQMPHQFVTDAKGLKTLKPGTTPVGWNGWDGSLNEPMNGEKGMLTEGGIRTPFVVHWKGTIPGGQVYPHPVISLDVAATANALAGLPDDPNLDGVNVVPYLSGKNTGVPHEALFWRWENQFAIRQGDWKYITLGDSEYLFNFASDPQEKHNLATTEPERAKVLRARLAKWTDTLIPAGLPEGNGSGKSKGAYGYFVDGEPGPTTSPKVKQNGKDEGEEKPELKVPDTTPKAQDDAGKNERLLKLFDLRDTNKDGRVTLEEFLAGRNGPTVPTLTRHFKELDRNGDGAWAKSETSTASKTKEPGE